MGSVHDEPEDPNEIPTRELREALVQIKKEFEEAHARELEEANRTHAREIAQVREEWKKAKETHEREMDGALSMIHQLQAQLKVVSH